MKRFTCNDSLNTLLISSQGEVKPNDNTGYSKEFQAMLEGLDEEDSIEETGHNNDKKRRLSNHQVKSLEKIFEVDNKLHPERKIKVAHDLGLEPKQVAIWFQNRRARWKSKQLEKDYNYLKNNYDTLKFNYEKMEQEKQILASQLKELKNKLSVKETEKSEVYQSLNYEQTKEFMHLKDGSSDSDSSGVLNEDNNNHIHDQLLISPPAFNYPSSDFSSLSYSQFSDPRSVLTQSYYQHLQLEKMEEQCLATSSDESCNIFLVDQAPTLCWYYSEERNELF